MGWGGAWGGPCPCPYPLLWTEQAQNVEVNRTLSAQLLRHSTHLCMNHCLCLEHSNLQLPKDSSIAVPQIHRLIPKGEAPRNAHTINCLSYTLVDINVAWLWWSSTASEALSYGLNFKIFLGEHVPQTPLECCVLCPPHHLLHSVNVSPYSIS